VQNDVAISPRSLEIMRGEKKNKWEQNLSPRENYHFRAD